MLILFDAAAIAFFLALLLTPLVRDGARRLGFVDEPDGRRKVHSRPIPRVGGVAVAFAYLTGLALLLVLPYTALPFDMTLAVNSALALFPAAGIVFLTGLWDDLRGLRPWQKLLGQAAGAGYAYWVGFGIHAFRGYELDYWLGLAVTIVWLVGCSNAVNLIDGMDGLAAGVGFFATMTTLVAALLQNNVMLAIATAPLAGSLLGFLRYNFNPASVFLGDSGSLLVGFLLGSFGLIWTTKSATVLGMTAPMMALAIPLLDAGLAVARRAMRNQSLWAGDRGHIHHRLLANGFTPRRAVLLLYAVCGLTAAFSLFQEATHNRYGGLVLLLFCATAWLGVQHLGYAEFGIARRLVFRGTFRGIIDVESRLVELDCTLRKAGTMEKVWQVLCAGCVAFGFSGLRLELGAERMEFGVDDPRLDSHWRLYIPLSGGGSLQLTRPPEGEIHPITLSSFAQVAQGAIEAQLALPFNLPDLPQADRKPAAPSPSSKASAAVGSAS